MISNRNVVNLVNEGGSFASCSRTFKTTSRLLDLKTIQTKIKVAYSFPIFSYVA